MRSRKQISIAILLIASGLSLIGYALGVGLFTQIAPPANVPALPFIRFGTCGSTLVQQGTLAPVTGNVTLGCGLGSPAIIVVNQNGHSFNATFTLPTTFTNSTGTFPCSAPCIIGPLGLWNIASGGFCSTQIFLTSKQLIALPSGNYDYCLNYASLPGAGATIPSWSISWS